MRKSSIVAMKFTVRSARYALIAASLLASGAANAQSALTATTAPATASAIAVSGESVNSVPPGLPAPAGSATGAMDQTVAIGAEGASVSGKTAPAHDQQWDANAFPQLEAALNAHTAVTPPSTHPDELKTLFFTAWQYALLNEAKQQFNTRPPSASEMQNDNGQKQSGPRELALGGISYRNAKDWTVWLNSQRIKPDAIPKEILDIRVSADHVDLKWFDNATNLIFPVRLRPHQRFNLDDRIFLPGTGT
jgi:hypothetical protein